MKLTDSKPEPMRTIFIIGFIALALNLSGQSDAYYWDRGEKVPLTLSTQKCFILFEKEYEEQVILGFSKGAREVSKIGEDNTVHTIIPYFENNNKENKK